MRISTTENADPCENAVAERKNGILKYEFGLVQTIPEKQTAKKIMRSLSRFILQNEGTVIRMLIRFEKTAGEFFEKLINIPGNNEKKPTIFNHKNGQPISG